MNCHSTEAGRLQRLGFASTQPTHDGCAGPKRTAYLLVVSQAGLAVLHCVSIAVSLLPRRCAATSAVARELSEGRGSDPQLSLLSYATRIGQGSRLRSCGFLRPGQALSRLSLCLAVVGDPWENRTPATASTARRPATERKGHGAHRRSRISKHPLLKMAALPVCLCAHCRLVNQPGFEPGTGFRLPIKSRVPSAARRHWSAIW